MIYSKITFEEWTVFKNCCTFAAGKSCTICSLSTPPGQECSKGTLVVAMRYK